MAKDPRMHPAFKDHAVPDGASTMGDDVFDGGAPGPGVGYPIEYKPEPEVIKYIAWCTMCKDEGYHENGWRGPDRHSYEAAQVDADDHNANYVRHNARVG